MEPSLAYPVLHRGLPANVGRYQKRFRRQGMFRIASRGGTVQFFFLPYLVLKFARTAGERRSINAEIAAARQAGRHPFWGDLATAGVGLAKVGKMLWRFRPLDGPDLLPVRGIVEDRMAAALSYPARPMLDDVERRSLFGELDGAERAAVAAILAAETVPRTSMHGDLHLWNFVGSGADGYRLIDWEYFDAEGSFVYDYLDFHYVTVSYTSGNVSWPAALATVGEDHPVFRAAAKRTGISARALSLYYLFIKIDTLLRMKPHWSDTERRPLFALLRQAIGGAGP